MGIENSETAMSRGFIGIQAGIQMGENNRRFLKKSKFSWGTVLKPLFESLDPFLLGITKQGTLGGRLTIEWLWCLSLFFFSCVGLVTSYPRLRD